MAFNKKFFTTGGIVASSPAAAAFNASENFGTVLYTGNGGTQSIGGNNVRLLLSDSGGHSMVASIRTLDSEFTQTKPTGYTEWGSDLTAFNGAFGGGSATLSNGNKTVTTDTSYFNGGYTNNNYSSGKYYAEIVQDSSTDTNDQELIVGIITGTSGLGDLEWRYSGVAYYSYTGNITRDNTDTISANTFVSNDVIGVACDLDAGLVEIFKNGTSQGTIAISKEPLNFQPDLVWVKSRNHGYSHHIQDVIRGAGALKDISSDGTWAEGTFNYGSVDSFDTNGFTVGSGGHSTYGYAQVNESGKTYVAWCWKAGGVPTPNNNTQGTITSTVSANQDAGFSIVKYIGNATDNATVGTGLSSPAELVIAKDLDNSQYWIVGGSVVGNGKTLYLNDTSELLTRDRIKSVQTNTFTLGSHFEINGNNVNFISYCFHSVDGYQRVSSYTGSGSSGKRIYTTDDGTSTGNGGFQPRFVMIKRYDSGTSESWLIFDSLRVSGSNESMLYPNLSNAEAAYSDYIDFNSDGFTMKDGGGSRNAASGTYIYLAIA